MRAYKVIAKDGDTVLGTRYAGTQADARTKRDELVNQFQVKKSQITIGEVEVSVVKADLIELLNELSYAADSADFPL